MKFSLSEESSDHSSICMPTGARTVVTNTLYEWFDQLPEETQKLVQIIRVTPIYYPKSVSAIQIQVGLKDDWVYAFANFKNAKREIVLAFPFYVFMPDDSEIKKYHLPEDGRPIPLDHVKVQLTASLKNLLTKELEAATELTGNIRTALGLLNAP